MNPIYNSIALVDAYKFDHRRQYPHDTRVVYSNWTPRGTRIPGQNEVVFFGLQYFLKKYLMEEMYDGFFSEPVDLVKYKYQRRIDGMLGPNSIGTEHIEKLHALGYIPLSFRALPEGTVCPTRVPMLTVENTDPEFSWVTNYFETLMSCILWMPCTSATIAYRMRKLLDSWAEKTGDPLFVPWQGHDFSFRGMAGLEAAMMSGAGHLLSFTGTDTVPALDFIEEYYGSFKQSYQEFLGGSVAATEHSVMCANGPDGECGSFERLIDLYPSGILSVVSDTWDLWQVLTKFLPALKDKILARDGKLVIRPDSGDPADILCGDPKYAGAHGAPQAKGVIELLWEEFGGTINDKGYRVLDPHVGAIYGDSITYDRASDICFRLESNGYASTNIVLGMGSFGYQYQTRDTFGFAMKATWADVGGEGRDLFKKPVTDSGEKFSAKGRLAVLRMEDGIVIPCSHTPKVGELFVVEKASPAIEAASLLTPVWKNGKFLRTQTFADIRKVLHGNRS